MDYRRSGLEPAAVAALALADAVMAHPGTIPVGLVADLRTRFAPEQITEIALDVLAFSKQKVLVSLGIDAPVHPDRPTPLLLDERGYLYRGVA